MTLLTAILVTATIEIKESQLLKLDRTKIDLGSLVASPDRTKIAYITADHKHVMLDGKKTGPFLNAAPGVFSADSKSFAFVAQRTRDHQPEMYLDGQYVQTANPVTKTVRLGETGPLAWIEQTKSGSELVSATFRSGPMPKVVRSSFGIDGKSYAFIYSEISKDPSKSAPDFVATSKTPSSPRGGINYLYCAPGGENFLGISVELNPSRGFWQSQPFVYPGEIIGQPVFSDSGNSFGLRSQFTAAVGDENKQFFQYTINQKTVRELEVQSGLAFRPGEEDYVLCGKRGENFYIKKSPALAVPYREFPGLEGAPNEAYKAAVWFGSKLAFVFQSRKTPPVIFVEGHGPIDIPVSEIYLPSLSVSPDGKYLAFFANKLELATPFVLSLENPATPVKIGKEDFGVDGATRTSPLWTSQNSLRFLGLRKANLIRFDVTIRD